MKILVQPGGPDRRVPWPPLTRPPRYFPQGKPTQVELDHYIQRRLNDGDLVTIDAPPAAPEAAAQPTAPTAAAEDPGAKPRSTIDTAAARSAADKKGD